MELWRLLRDDYLLSPSIHAAPVFKSDALEEQERLLVLRAMETAGGNQSEAARIQRIGRDAMRCAKS